MSVVGICLTNYFKYSITMYWKGCSWVAMIVTCKCSIKELWGKIFYCFIYCFLFLRCKMWYNIICENSVDLATNGEKNMFFYMWKFNWFGNKWKKKPYFSWTVQLILFVKEKQSQNFELYKYLKSYLNVKKGNM